jgi:hypothetical protein
MQKRGRYNFDLVMRHSNTLAIESRRNNKERHHSARKTLSFLGTIIDEIGNEGKSHQRNVRMALTTRFYNHLFSQLILTERGLFLDAANASRSATETTAFYWLVCLDPNSAALYDDEKSPRPVEIRKKLENLGIDVADIQDIYQHQSDVSHVGNFYDNMQIRWGRQNNGELYVGGGANIEIEHRSYNAITASILLFLRHDPTYEVCVSESDT